MLSLSLKMVKIVIWLDIQPGILIPVTNNCSLPQVEDASLDLAEEGHLAMNPDDAQPGERQQSGEVEEAIGEPQMDTAACSVDDSVWEIPSEASEDPDMLKAPKDDGHFCSSELSTLLNGHVEGSISLPALLRAIAKLPRHGGEFLLRETG